MADRTKDKQKQAQRALEGLLRSVDDLRKEHEDEANRSAEPSIKVDRQLINHLFESYGKLMR